MNAAVAELLERVVRADARLLTEQRMARVSTLEYMVGGEVTDEARHASRRVREAQFRYESRLAALRQAIREYNEEQLAAQEGLPEELRGEGNDGSK